jgi:FHS family L-fucose permease-like MFS transporter
MAIPAGLFINKFGYRSGVVFGLLLFAFGAFLFIPGVEIGTLEAFLICLFIIACGLAFLETSANPYVTELGPLQTATSRLNLSQSFNGLGSSLAPFIMGSFLFGNDSADVSLPYTIMGFVVIVVAIVFLFSKLPEISHDDDGEITENVETDSEDSGIHNLALLFKNKMFVFGLLALLAYEVSEISINSYFVNFTTGMGWIDASKASYILSFSLFIFMGGRFFGSWIMKTLPAERMLLYCAIGSVVSIVGVIVFSNSEKENTDSWFRFIPIAFLMVNYFCEAIMFPTIFALALKGLGKLTKSASSVLMMTPVGGCGFLLMAYVADYSGSFIIPFIIPLVGYVIILAYSRKLVKKQ